MTVCGRHWRRPVFRKRTSGMARRITAFRSAWHGYCVVRAFVYRNLESAAAAHQRECAAGAEQYRLIRLYRCCRPATAEWLRRERLASQRCARSVQA